jgi:2-polyprenyl-3-methyl-5-hydroxy-6-metoxy-1,4-benzoquinol methylase
MFRVVEWLEKFQNPSLEHWIRLSVAGGILGVDEKSFHAATSVIDSVQGIRLNQPGVDQDQEVKRVADELWQTAQSPCRIDATELFIHTLDVPRQRDFRIVSFPDDYLETILLLKAYEKLLAKFLDVVIDIVPRSLRCSNDATYSDIIEFIQRFPGLKANSRFRISEYGPQIGGVNLRKLHPDVIELVRKSDLLDVRGARNYEMMQGVHKQAFFGFIVCREFSESVTGLLAEDRPFIYLRQGHGERSFEGFAERHKRIQHGKMFARVTVNDRKQKWEGGYLTEYDSWSLERQKRYQVVREFYNVKAEEFAERYGRDLEAYVKEFLNQFTGRILVIGCGSGKEVKYLLDRGCDAYGIDFSSEAIRFANTLYNGLEDRLYEEDFYNLDILFDGKFDGIIANASLVHLLDRGDMPKILQKIHDRLNPNGLCFIRLIDKEIKEQEEL